MSGSQQPCDWRRKGCRVKSHTVSRVQLNVQIDHLRPSSGMLGNVIYTDLRFNFLHEVNLPSESQT